MRGKPTRPSQLSQDEFVAVFADVYESSPWVARGAWLRRDEGVDDPVEICAVMKAVVDVSPRDRLMALVRAHPDLAGRAARAGELTAASTREQSAAGLDQCTADEFDEFHRLNTAYKDRFGFPFIIAVAGLDRQQILASFRSRIANTPDDEFRAAMDQIHRIARLRVTAIFGARDH